MRRRELLQLPLGGLAAPVGNLPDLLTPVFLDILHGYLGALSRTSGSLAVCEFYDATITKGFRAKSGLSVTAVTRMLPALSAWIVGGRQPQTVDVNGRAMSLLDVVLQMCRTAFDPSHPDYWLPAADNKSDQRQVESSVVAWSIWLLRHSLLPKLSSDERKRINNWLASCTRHPVRNNNWAWFTALNQAVRLSLSSAFREFTFDENWMLDDLKALDGMARGEEGWYSDSLEEPMFDYYNSWVFASHFLYWNRIAGRQYPDWSRRFGDRLQKYLATAPLFFGGNGSHVLYGRSLIYRFAVLTPLVLAYEQGVWPHSAGLLRAIVQRNIQFFWQQGAFDRQRGKFRETMSDTGSPDIKEPYIDGGHPYWAMQAFAMFLIRPRDRFWTDPVEKLPVEKADYVRPIHSAGLLLSGSKRTGDVRLYNALSTRPDIHYRDKYNKLAYSTEYPMCIVQSKTVCPWDNALVLRDIATGTTAGRGPIERSRIRPNGVELTYTLMLNAASIRASTRIMIEGAAEEHVHILDITAPETGYELLEGSPAMANAITLEARDLAGWISVDRVSDFGPVETARSNTLAAHFQVLTLRAPVRPGKLTLSARWVRTTA